ncbi:hypothetical protein ACW23B_19625 [Streptomyces albidoflavus]
MGVGPEAAGTRPRPRAQARSSGSVRYGPGGPSCRNPASASRSELLGLGLTEPERGRGLVGPAGRPERGDPQEGVGERGFEPGQRLPEHLGDGEPGGVGEGEPSGLVGAEPAGGVGEAEPGAGQQPGRHDAQGQRVVAAALGYAAGLVRFGVDAFGAEDGAEQGVRLGRAERPEPRRPPAVGGDQPGEAAPAGDHDGPARTGGEQRPHLVGAGRVVQDQQGGAAGRAGRQGAGELSGDGLRVVGPPVRAGQADQQPAAGETVGELGGDVPGQRGLADAGGAGEDDGQRAAGPVGGVGGEVGGERGRLGKARPVKSGTGVSAGPARAPRARVRRARPGARPGGRPPPRRARRRGCRRAGWPVRAAGGRRPGRPRAPGAGTP